MSLLDIWESSSEELRAKRVSQLLQIAGDGKLRDENETSKELREFLRKIPSFLLQKYANECLVESFSDSGLVLQDILNEVGSRIGYAVTPGRYRGKQGVVGSDGLWKTWDGHGIVVEIKTTDAYRIDLEVIEGYRKQLIKAGEIEEEHSSILIVVGREDTGGLEAQVRGSKFAWDIRLISVDSLIRLMIIKEDTDDPSLEEKIYQILVPREYTRVDEIIDIVFSATEDIKELSDQGEENEQNDEPKFIPSKFHDECIRRIESVQGQNLIKRTRTKFSSPTGAISVVCIVSKEHPHGSYTGYWYAFHPHYKEFLSVDTEGYVAFGCGSADEILLIPYADFSRWLSELNQTHKEKRSYYHVHIHKDSNGYKLERKAGADSIDLTKYLLKP